MLKYLIIISFVITTPVVDITVAFQSITALPVIVHAHKTRARDNKLRILSGIVMGRLKLVASCRYSYLPLNISFPNLSLSASNVLNHKMINIPQPGPLNCFNGGLSQYPLIYVLLKAYNI